LDRSQLRPFPKESLEFTTYPLLAKSFYKLCCQIEEPKKLEIFEQEIIEMLGEEWQSSNEQSLVI